MGVGDTALLLLIGYNIEISFMFAMMRGRVLHCRKTRKRRFSASTTACSWRLFTPRSRYASSAS
jgi:hypothetical protein